MRLALSRVPRVLWGMPSWQLVRVLALRVLQALPLPRRELSHVLTAPLVRLVCQISRRAHRVKQVAFKLPLDNLFATFALMVRLPRHPVRAVVSVVLLVCFQMCQLEVCLLNARPALVGRHKSVEGRLFASTV
jgi:hypothetical protein